jgi:hypothetical protein
VNAIILCSHRLERQQNADQESLTCLRTLGGLPALIYILAGLARLCVTRIVLATPSNGARRIRAISTSLLPRALVSYAPCPVRVPYDSISAVASPLRFVEPTGLLIVDGNCIFGTDLAGRVVGMEAGILPYLAEEEYKRGDDLVSLTGEQIKQIGLSVVPEIASGRALGLRYFPRGYLPVLRGVLVELIAAGAGEAPFGQAVRVMIERGYPFQGVRANGALFAEVNEACDLPFATSVALELQRRGGLEKYSTRKEHLDQGKAFRAEELPDAQMQGQLY